LKKEKNMSKRLLTGLTLCVMSTTLWANAPKVEGLWQAAYVKSGTPSADICVKTQANGNLSGVMVKAYPRPGEHPVDKCTACTGAQKDKPYEGLQVLWGMKPAGTNTWDSGTLLDAETGKEYSGTMKLSADGNHLDMRGYILGIKFLGATETWKRIGDAC
jgi:uncharacterized protein (DUF2147 family)